VLVLLVWVLLVWVLLVWVLLVWVLLVWVRISDPDGPSDARLLPGAGAQN
jgi:hypothetical protein